MTTDVRSSSVLQSCKTFPLPDELASTAFGRNGPGLANLRMFRRKTVELLARDGAAQDARDLPDGRLRDRHEGPTPQDRADDGKALEPIAINLKLLAPGGIWNGESRWQPIVGRDEARHEIAAYQENLPLAFGEFDHGLDVPDKSPQRGGNGVSLDDP